MQLTICLKDGRQFPFTIADDQPGSDFLKNLKFWEIFDRPILRIHDRSDTWAFQPGAIEKILFLTQEDPGWQPAENILSAKSITAETCQRKLAALGARQQVSEQAAAEGRVFASILTITLASGQEEYFECTLMLRPRREQQFGLYHLFQKIAYPYPAESGGFVLLNPANIFCIQIHPSLPEDTESAWLVDAFSGSASEDRARAADSAGV
jgi:hypothetical protein